MIKKILFLFISRILLSFADKTLDIIRSSNINDLNSDEIIRILTHNMSNIVENVTNDLFDDFIDTNECWTSKNAFAMDQENIYYGKFENEINFETKRLLDTVPAFDPALAEVSPDCKRQSAIFHAELRKMTLWALKMYDATAKIPSGLLSGNVNQFGDFDECLSVQGSSGIQGQYCLAYLSVQVDDKRPDLKHLHRLLHSHYFFKNNYTDSGHRVPRLGIFHWALCTPASCSNRDVEMSLKATIEKYTTNTGLQVTVRVDEEMCQVQRNKSLPLGTIIVGMFFLGIIAVSVVSGVLDHCNLHANQVVMAFSLKRNFKKLISLKRSTDDIPVLHGIRFFNAFMLIVAHKCMALLFNPYINRTGMSEHLGRPWTVIGRAASLYTDPFIMLSGLLTTYSFVKQLRASGRIDIRKEYFSRLFRLIPTLGALILFCTFITPQIGSGPQWNLVVTHHANLCRKTWWRNLLFIHNYFGFENICLTHTHHVAIDTQLFFASPLLILLLAKWPKAGGLVLALLAALSTALRFYVTYTKNLSNYIYFGTSSQKLFETANLSYTLPTHRLTVYIIGIFIGYFLRRHSRTFHMGKILRRIGWIFTTLAWAGAFFGPAGMGSINYIYNPLHAAAYNAFAPIGWCALFAWIVILSSTTKTNDWISRLFAWRGFLIFTRLSYAIYLTQFPVFFYNVGETRSAEYYEFIRMMLNIKELIWIVITSIALTLLFDFPFQNLKSFLLSKSQSSTNGRVIKID